MADPPKQETAKNPISGIFTPLRNKVALFLRDYVGLPTHEKVTERIDVSSSKIKERINKEINLDTVKRLNKLMFEQAEKGWEGYDESIEHYWSEVIQLYSFKKNPDKEAKPENKWLIKDTEFRDSIGPFTYKPSLDVESLAAPKGTGFRDETIIIKKGDEAIRGTFSIPRLIPIHYYDGRANPESVGEPRTIEGDLGIAYKIAFIGADSSDKYWGNLDREIQQIIDEVKNWHLERETDPKKRNNVVTRINTIKTYINGIINKELKNTIRTIEDSHRSNLFGSTGIQGLHPKAEAASTKLIEKKLKDDKVYFVHTYKIIKQYCIKNIEAQKEELILFHDAIKEFEKRSEHIADPGEVCRIEFECLTMGVSQKENMEVIVHLDTRKNPYEEFKLQLENEVQALGINNERRNRLNKQRELQEVESKLNLKFEALPPNLQNKVMLRIFTKLTQLQSKEEHGKIKNADFEALKEVIQRNISSLFPKLLNRQYLHYLEYLQEIKDRLRKYLSDEGKREEFIEYIVDLLHETKKEQIGGLDLKELVKQKWRILYEISSIRKKIREFGLASIKLDNLSECIRIVNEVRNKPDYRRFLRDSLNFPWEQGIGLDENGYPLEVGDGEMDFTERIDLGDGKFKTKTYKLNKGEVLLDRYLALVPKDSRRYRAIPEDHRRMAPEDFIADCDLMDWATWAHVHYDSWRDDLRDARYHNKSITVMDRIMRELKNPYFSINEKRRKGLKYGENFWTSRNVSQSDAVIKLNKLPPGSTEEEKRPSGDPDFVKMKMKASHLNPAFDTRAKGNDIHLGRVFYYDVQDHCEQSPYPTITTRGAALYILHRVIEESKYWGGKNQDISQGYRGVIETLLAISKVTEGYDIGANMGRPEAHYPGWGKPLPRNPFKPQRG
ncbi:hypothetical protein HYS31_05480 [Candidatus Woesearchaeota archaeon]|nr:hypothetical protein [Candidatus Woesearchaeota archaeon]